MGLLTWGGDPLAWGPEELLWGPVPAGGRGKRLRWQSIGSDTATDSHDRIGSRLANKPTGKIGSDE